MNLEGQDRLTRSTQTTKQTIIRSCILLTCQLLLMGGAFGNKTIQVHQDIRLIQCSESVYIHTTWHESEQFGRFPSNGLLIVAKGEAILVDTPPTDELTTQLLSFLKDSMQVNVTQCIVCHHHIDCLGGLNTIHAQGIESVANQRTIKLCQQLKLPLPQHSFDNALQFNFHHIPIECRFFGEGHTSDNITVALPNQHIVFGGCLIKSSYSKGLGNIEDANVSAWDDTVLKLMNAYPDVELVVPGHGAHGGVELLSHTVTLIQNKRSDK